MYYTIFLASNLSNKPVIARRHDEAICPVLAVCLLLKKRLQKSGRLLRSLLSLAMTAYFKKILNVNILHLKLLNTKYLCLYTYFQLIMLKFIF